MSEQRIRYLDGLRGILAIIVFLHHFFYLFYPDIIFGGQYAEYQKPGLTFNKFMAFSPLNIFFNPGMAIHFFFILSGYVQAFHYFKSNDLHLLQKSFIKRYFRLTIPVLSVLILVFICHKLHLVTRQLVPPDPITGGWTNSMMPHNLSWLKVLKHGLVDCFKANSKYYQILWTMPIELINSWMVLILLFVTHNLKNKAGLLIFWLMIQLFVIGSYYSAAFTIGLLLCYAEMSAGKFNAFLSKKLSRYFCLLAGLYLASYPFIGYEKSTVKGFFSPISFFETYPHIISYLTGDTLLFCFLLTSAGLQSLLAKRVFRFFGDISFMFYLVHLLVLLTFSPWLFFHLSSVVSKSSNLALSMLASFIIISLLSYLLYRFIDKPVLTWCNIYVKKFLGV